MAVYPIPAEKMAAYREGLRRRLNRPLTPEEQKTLEIAWREARQVAERLVKQHGAKRVILFGSVARQRRLRRDSDIDLAVEGMPAENFYQIVGVRNPVSPDCFAQRINGFAARYPFTRSGCPIR